MRLLPLMCGVEAHVGIRMKDGRSGKPASARATRQGQSDPVFLAAAPKRTHPAADHLLPKTSETGHIPRHRMVVEVCLDNRSQPLPELSHGQMSAS